jgi:tRNA threonylcarbamoyladenosine modification (KEOPS) complex  Pcc1 subunit
MKVYDKSILLTVSFDSKKQAAHIARCLEPEIRKDQSQMTIRLSQMEEMIKLEISSQQTSMMRAAVNSYLRWIETAYSVHSL